MAIVRMCLRNSSPLAASNRRCSYFSMPKAFTTRIPVMVSISREVISPKVANRSVVSRLLRLPKREIRKKATGMITSDSRNNSQLRYTKMARKMRICGISRSGPATLILSAFCRLSRSEVKRAMRSPAGRSVKNEKLSFWRWL